MRTSRRAGFIKELPETVVDAVYNIYQPVRLPTLSQEGELQLPNNVIPAFYLKAFNDKNAWDNTEKAIWLAVDVVSIFVGAQGLLQLRRLTYLSSLQKAFKITIGITQLTSGVLNAMLTFVNDCKSGSFCDKLRTYLFWVDIATLSIDAITHRMLKKAAKEALDEAAISKQAGNDIPDEILEHLDEASVVIDSFGDVYKLRYFRTSSLYAKLTKSVVIEKYGAKAGGLFEVVEKEWVLQQSVLKSGNKKMEKVLISGMIDNETGAVSKLFSNFTDKEIYAGLHAEFIERLHPTLKKRLEIHLQKRGINGSGLNLADPDVIKFAWKEMDIAHAEFRALDDLLKQIDQEGKLGEAVFGRILGYNSFLKKPGIQIPCADCFYLTHGITFIK